MSTPTPKPRAISELSARSSDCAFCGTKVETMARIPGEIYVGLPYCCLHKIDAKRACLDYCREQQRFPVGTTLMEYLGSCGCDVSTSSNQINPTIKCVVKVQRSNGDVEGNWVLLSDGRNPIVFNTRHNELIICVSKPESRVEKHISLVEFCNINGVDYDSVIGAIQKDLEMFYELEGNVTSDAR